MPGNTRDAGADFMLRTDYEQSGLASAFWRSLPSWLLPVGMALGAVAFGAVLSYVMVNFSPALALLGFLVVPTALLLVTRPNLALLLLVFAIPLEDFNQLGGGLSVLKLLSVAVFGGAALHFFVFRRHDRLIYAPQNWFVGLFLLTAILSYFVAITPEGTFDRTLKLLRVLSLYLVTINIIRTENDFRWLVLVFLFSGCICAAYSFYAYFFNHALLEVGSRITGTMDDPNEFAGAMVARLPLALCLLRVERRWFKWLLLLAGAGVIVWGVTMAGSRGGLLALGCGLCAFILTQKRKTPWLVAVVLVLLIVLVAMPLSFRQRIGLLAAGTQDSSLERRLTYQVYGMQLFKAHPVLGIGISGFSEAYSRSEYRFLQVGIIKRVAHNTYMEVIVGTGLIGLLPFLALLAISLWRVWKIARRGNDSPYLQSVAAGLFGGLVSYLVSCMFLSEQYEKTLWLLLAMIVIAQQLAGKQERR